MSLLNLIIEINDKGRLWGRVLVDDNLIIDEAATQEELEIGLKVLIKEFHGIDPDTIVFEVQYDLEAFFQRFDYLKITGIAREAYDVPRF